MQEQELQVGSQPSKILLVLHFLFTVATGHR